MLEDALLDCPSVPGLKLLPAAQFARVRSLEPKQLRKILHTLSEKADFMLVTAYAVKASSVTLYNALEEANRKRGGSVSVGEVCNQDHAGRLLSMAVYGRWMSGSGVKG